MQVHARSGQKNREKIVPGQVEHRGHDGQALRSVSVRLRAELEAMFSLSQPALYLWLEAPHSDNQCTHLGALAPGHTPRPKTRVNNLCTKQGRASSKVKTACMQ